jgi:hypothetical protein
MHQSIGMSRRAKKICSNRGENRARLIVTAPTAASTPMPMYQSKIAARAMPPPSPAIYVRTTGLGITNFFRQVRPSPSDS